MPDKHTTKPGETMTCEACGRETERMCVVHWRVDRQVRKRHWKHLWRKIRCDVIHTYKVCAPCSNGFVMVACDGWAADIARRRCLGDEDKVYPPLIDGRSYEASYRQLLEGKREFEQIVDIPGKVGRSVRITAQPGQDGKITVVTR